MANKFDEAFAELNQIRNDMASLDDASIQTQIDVIARDIRTLAYHVEQLIRREIRNL